MIIDGFAGPGGWDEGLRMIGRTDVVGLEWDKAACATAKAAGHNRIRCDIAMYPTKAFAGQTVEGVIQSPPCQAWSMAGKRKGELDRENCHHLADRMADGDDSTDWTEWEDQRSPLVCQPIRWVRDLSPEWVALEEVPQVAGLWEHFARILRGWGYNVWTGDLLAADYGVPQTRLRRILMAHKTLLVHPPMPTHAEHIYGAGLFGPDVKPWVSMADALGWGGSVAGQARDSGPGAEREPRSINEPSYTIRAQGSGSNPAGVRWVCRPGERPPVYVNGNQPNAARRGLNEPAPTIAFGHAAGSVRWVSAGVTGQGRPKTPEQPADTITGKGTAYWVHDRPATTVVGSFRPDVIAGPGHHDTSRQDAPGSVRVTVQEAGVLQSFPADYPWQGSKSKQYEQVGNAIPPLLAAHVLAALGVGELAQERAA